LSFMGHNKGCRQVLMAKALVLLILYSLPL
jgi:hypothetical protein